MNPADGVMGLIPAGGRSSRFGAPKALHVLEGISLVQRVYSALSGVLTDIRVGLAYEGDSSPIAGLPVVYDDPPAAGVSGSLRAAFRASSHEWVLVAACDMPGVTSDSVRRLLDARGGDAEVVVSIGRDRAVHPLFSCYRRSCLGALDRHVAGEHRSMRGFVAGLRRVEVVFEASVLWNVNQPQDLGGP